MISLKVKLLHFLSLYEIENRTVLEDLISESQLKEVHHKIVHIESPVERRIDIAFFYDSHIFTITSQ